MPAIRQLLRAARRLGARFVAVDALATYNTIIYKAANLLAAEKLEGDYLEFGVFAGDSLIQSYHTLRTVFAHHQQLNAGRTEEDAAQIRRLWQELRFFAFDSFEGLPDPQGIDQQGQDFAKGKYACTEASLRRQLAARKVDLSKVVTVPGWFEDTCVPETRARYQMRKAAIVHIDCDLYASTKAALDFVTPLLNDGTVLIFDDWFCFRGNPALGEQRAFREWRETLPDWEFSEYQKEGPWANSFIAHRRLENGS